MMTLSYTLVFIVGLMIGGTGGVLAMCLVIMARDTNNDASDNMCGD